MPGRFFPWDTLYVQMMFAVCTTFLWQGVWVGVEAWYSFTDVRREFRFEAGVYSTSPARAHLQLGHASPQPRHVMWNLAKRGSVTEAGGWGASGLGLLEAILFSPSFKGQEPKSFDPQGSGPWSRL